MRGLFEAGRRVQDFLETRGWKFCFIGGIALQRWGIPRLTRDLDISLFTGFGGESKFAMDLLAEFPGRIPDARAFAEKNRVLLLKTSGEIGIDVALAGFPFEEEIIDRAFDFEFLTGLKLRTCSGEDLIVMKAFASRTQDWADIEGIVARSGQELDFAAVEKRLKPLSEIKKEPDFLGRLRTLIRCF